MTVPITKPGVKNLAENIIVKPSAIGATGPKISEFILSGRVASILQTI